MTRFIIAALLALTIAGNAAAAEKDIYDENWYTHHLVCGDKKPAEPFLTNLHTYSFIHFTFQNDIDGKVIKLIGQREGIQFPSFAKVTTYHSFQRNGGIHWSKIEKSTADEIVITFVTQYLNRLHNSRFTLSRTNGTFDAKYFSIFINGERKDHKDNHGVCWLSDGKLF